jgi:uncharacterized protein (TIGR00369 family)
MNEAKMREMFQKANFVNDIGIEITKVESGICETRLKILPKHLQQTGVVHAGVLATIADHTAGGASATMLKDQQYILTAEFKISLLRSAQGSQLRCISRVLKPGKSLFFVESEVFDVRDGAEKLVAKASVTLAVLTTDSSHG